MPVWWCFLDSKEQENLGGDDLDILWGRVCIWDSLWVSISSAFRNSSFFAIYLDWPAAVGYLSVMLFLVGFGGFRSSFSGYLVHFFAIVLLFQKKLFLLFF